MIKKIGVFISLIFFVIGCNQIPFSNKTVKKSEVKLPTIKGVLLAQVDDWAIGLDDFNNQLTALKSISPEIDINNPAIKETLLNEMITTQLLSNEAKNRGFDKDSDVLKAVDTYKRNILAQKMREKLDAELTVTDVEVENFYNEYKEALRQPQERKIREIVVPTETQAKEIFIKLLNNEDFSQLSRTYSISETKDKGGDLGYVQPTQQMPKKVQVAFTTDKDGVSNYFKDEKGNYCIIKVEDIREGRVVPLSEAKEEIRKGLQVRKLSEKINEIATQVRARVKVEIKEDLIKSGE